MKGITSGGVTWLQYGPAVFRSGTLPVPCLVAEFTTRERQLDWSEQSRREAESSFQIDSVREYYAAPIITEEARAAVREFFIENLLVRIHCIIEMIWWIIEMIWWIIEMIW